MLPKYSICIPNLNMEHTLEIALRSVLNQINEDFEVVVVDDGSRDKSLKILNRLANEYRNLRVFSLKRDRKRTLAETRNYSVSKASGEYLILHIDCDDYWYPYLKDFTKVYHLIEAEIGNQFLLSGYQFHMGYADFLRHHGPYKYGHMVEDRDLWYRMAKIGKWLPLEHVVFRRRMQLGLKKRLSKYFLLSIRIQSDEIRQGAKLFDYIELFLNRKSQLSKLFRIYKIFIFPLAFIRARILGEMNIEKRNDWDTLKTEAWKKSGTLVDFFAKRGKIPDLSELSPGGKWIFTNSSKDHVIEDMPKQYRAADI